MWAAGPPFPWIAYQDEAYDGSMEGVKAAYLDAAAFTSELSDIYGTSIQGWETMHVPARYQVQNARIGLENWPTRNFTGTAARPAGGLNYTAAIGYLALDLYRIAYYVKAN